MCIQRLELPFSVLSRTDHWRRKRGDDEDDVIFVALWHDRRNKKQESIGFLSAHWGS